jgi:signal transduction histidine kinase
MHYIYSRTSGMAASLSVLAAVLRWGIRAAGYFGEQEGQLRSDASAVARVARQAHKSTRPDETITAIFSELFASFEPAQVQLALHEIPTGRIHTWQMNRSGTHPSNLIRHEFDFACRDQLFLGDSDECLLGVRSARSSHAFDVRTFRPEKFIKSQVCTLADDLFPKQFRSFICVPLMFGDEWEVRIFLWDPCMSRFSRHTVRAVAEASNRLGPIIFAAALQQYLGSRAAAEERARFGRELHDGIMPSLSALDLRIMKMLQNIEQTQPEYSGELVSIQQTLRGEIGSLRQMIHQNRLIEIVPTRLLPFLSETVSRFQKDTGISAHFLCELDEVHLPPATSYELARIVQEGLTNVRKHSGATNVAVRFHKSDSRGGLVITDDGHAFDFVGRYTFEQLDAARKGPFVIKERVRAISGDMAIESFPDRGARVEITFPMEQK